MSNTGTWMQNVTVPYVVYLVTRSATWVGLAALVQLFPSVVLSPLAGWLADRYERRIVVLAGQSVQCFFAVGIWAAWVAGLQSPGLLLVLLGLGGAGFGLTIPSWQALVTELVPRKDLWNAITLNSAQFNGARAIGPAAAGLILARFGPSWAFLINALSFLAVIVALLIIRPKPLPRDRPPRQFLKQFFLAAVYLRRRQGLRTAFGLVAAVFFFGTPVFQLAPVFAEQVYRVGAGRYGLLTAGYGVGAVAGGIVLGAFLSHRHRSEIATGAIGLYSLSLAGLGLAPFYGAGLLFVCLTGVAFLLAVATLNTSVQMLVAEEMRGRVLAIYFTGLTGAYPLGALLQGAVADRIGARATVLLAALAMFVLWCVLVLRPQISRSLDTPADDLPPVLGENIV